ncbi:MAG: 23S rRNA (pseudouridine(1915)-N(3))-methyltransferase RlmH [Proteobacteria bacterium]|nr:23S rRNA (pseudouridine(1915)-N(3))-methyltransferase RlmH [Pseudomonadota bacterium]MBU1715919.1 23S rRNA (pseudouridine(1915)-N(3))-methyltransferase RlmH [Pseudomonadota bacterium]
MNFEFIFPGKTREKYLATGIDDFCSRLKHHARIDIKIIKETKCVDPKDEKAKEAEGEAILKHVSKGSVLVALDLTGQQMSSEGLAKQLAEWQDGGCRKISFVIGGPDGLPANVVSRADKILSLSKMTLTHEMARLLLMEQLYRAFTILAGTGYHK